METPVEGDGNVMNIPYDRNEITFEEHDGVGVIMAVISDEAEAENIADYRIENEFADRSQEEQRAIWRSIRDTELALLRLGIK
jgi:hypothetical protein